MISPAVVEPIIRHLDAIDEALSRRVTRKSRWEEPALTSQLCDLLDEETQGDERLKYTFEELSTELGAIDGLVRVNFGIDTHEYDPTWEHWVTQADLGLVVRLEDRMIPENSWSASWLLQAKRAYPRNRTSGVFDETSRFPARDPQQQMRMERLVEVVGVPFVRYLLYCARPSDLDGLTRHKLAHLRNTSLSSHIFDYVLGLQLHRELMASDSSLAAGIFVASIDDCPRNIGDVHRKCLRGCLPLSWFLASHLDDNGWSEFVGRTPRRHARHSRRTPRHAPGNGESWANGIVTGDPNAVKKLMDELDTKNAPPFPMLPRHTITIRITAGPDENQEGARILLE